MVGGAFLCFEGCEKLAHKFLHSPEEDAVERERLTQANADAGVDLVAMEKDKIKGAVRTDFILSAEIIADRKSTRLNSSHLVISYAVFCLKKKKNKTQNNHINNNDMDKSHPI